MRIKTARQILKAFADDTRLRLINLLGKEVLSVAELCQILDKNQSNISKHLAKMRHLGIVSDKRDGLNVYYYLPKTDDRLQKELYRVVTIGLAELAIFKRDLGELKRLDKKKNKGG